MVLVYPSLRITFKLKEPLDCLLNKGRVYTIRPFAVREGIKRVIDGRTNKVVAIASVTKVGRVYLSRMAVKVQDKYISLSNFVEFSGFNSLEEWIVALGVSGCYQRILHPWVSSDSGLHLLDPVHRTPSHGTS